MISWVVWAAAAAEAAAVEVEDAIMSRLSMYNIALPLLLSQRKAQLHHLHQFVQVQRQCLPLCRIKSHADLKCADLQPTFRI
jgi:hypothetical protein